MKTKQKLGPLQKAWVRSLESGNFRQARGYLCKKNPKPRSKFGPYSFCCLGIACEVAIANDIKIETEEKQISKEVIVKYDQMVEFLNDRMADIFGFYGFNGSFRYYKLDPEEVNELERLCKGHDSLTSLNDSGFTFKEIAKIVKKFPHAIFKDER